ncbi:MAG TPA: PQQ-dependent sugar dehydrogenase [Anaerolineae bacterium]|nr:PQQ-dependent sugar dehydrogenase [Anaerolineae bacterium]
MALLCVAISVGMAQIAGASAGENVGFSDNPVSTPTPPPPPSAISLQPVASGLAQPVAITHAFDKRLFIVERAGRIRIVNASGALLATPFLNITSRVDSTDGEQGLLGLAFHPNYVNNGYFYVYYTYDPPGVNLDRTRISRFSRSAGNANQANAASELILMEFEQPFSNHNAGDLHFGEDGYLYIASGGAVITEKSLQDAVIMARYCERPNPLARDGWELDFMLTSSDGLQVSDVRYQGKPVLDSAKLVDWHVSYSGTDGFGYSDATGCPMFSTASVVAFDAPYVEEIVEDGQVTGFALSQDFRNELWPQPCNYRYVQRYEFYNDGRFRVGGSVLGQGCGNNGAYRPVVRIALATQADGGQPAQFADWDGQQWRPWSTEQWVLQEETTPVTAEGFQFRIDATNGERYYVEPNRGQLPDGRRGDHAYTFVTVARPGEGDADLLTIGPCCNDGYQQGPEQYMDPPDSLEGQDLVLWYVPQIENDDTPGDEYCWVTTEVVDGELVNQIHPCAFSALFVPASLASTP